MRLFHVSEQSDIDQFEPGMHDELKREVVWAVDDDHLPNYLLPRDCPRVCVINRKLNTYQIDVPKSYKEEVLKKKIYIYEMPLEQFEEIDSNAGYYISTDVVKPLSVNTVPDCVRAQRAFDVKLVFNEAFRERAEKVAKSKGEWSIIRYRI